jgi:hypothetical protein
MRLIPDTDKRINDGDERTITSDNQKFVFLRDVMD